jgi:hypothetical protein
LGECRNHHLANEVRKRIPVKISSATAERPHRDRLLLQSVDISMAWEIHAPGGPARRVVRNYGDGRNESVAATRDSSDDALIGIAECASQLTHAMHKGIVRNEYFRPYRTDDHVFGNQMVSALCQEEENVVSFRPQ